MLQHDLGQVREQDLQQLVTDQASESTTLEFKVKPHGTADDEKAELAKDVSAMANSDGGDIVFGIAEVKYVASRLTGITGEDYDPLVRRITQTLEAKVDPRIHGVRYHKVPLASGSYALVVRVPPSYDGPHSVRQTQELRRFVFRNGVSVSDMTYQQLRAAFDRTATLLDRSRAFISGRLELIQAGRTPKRLESGPVAVVHVLPIAGLDGRHAVDLRALHDGKYARFLPQWEGGSRTFNFDGLVIHTGGRRNDEHRGYAQIFRTGVSESATIAGGTRLDPDSQQPRKVVWPGRLVQSYRTSDLTLTVPSDTPS
jgi:hypothetical protein